jgi:hypothetical protein
MTYPDRSDTALRGSTSSPGERVIQPNGEPTLELVRVWPDLASSISSGNQV